MFAVPSGAAHEVSTERGAGPTLVADHGDRVVPEFDPAWLTTGQITFAQAETYWKDSDPQKGEAGPTNFAHWGYELNYAQGPTCVGSGTSENDHNREVELRTIYIGFSSEGSCVQSPGDLRADILAVEASEPRLLASLQFRDEPFEMAGTLLGTGPAAPPTAHESRGMSATALGFREPDIQVAAVASTSLLAVFLAVYFLPLLKTLGAQALFLVPGYAKLRKDELMDNKIRDQLAQSIKQDPGQSITELVGKTGAGWGTVTYHLRVLEKNGIINSIVDGRHHRFFPVDTVNASDRGQLSVLRNERTKALFELIQSEVGIEQRSLAGRFGISAPAVTWHVKRLEDVGLIARIRNGRRYQLVPNEDRRVEPAYDPRDAVEVV